MQKIRVGDEVIVIAGKASGQRGTVRSIRKDQRCIVSGVNMAKRHKRPDPQRNVTGGIVEQEAPIHISNIALYSEEAQGAEKVGIRVRDADGKSVRERYFKTSDNAVPEVQS